MTTRLFSIARLARLAVPASLAVLAALAGCGGNDDSVRPRRIYTVTYSLNISGESSVSEVTYYGGGQYITWDNPPNGWSLQFPVGDGNTVSATAFGSAKSGSIVLYMRVEREGTDPVVMQDECSESQGTATICNLDTGEVKLK